MQGFDYWEVLPGQGAYNNPSFKTAEGTTRYKGYTTDIITDKALEWLDGNLQSEGYPSLDRDGDDCINIVEACSGLLFAADTTTCTGS